MKARFVVNLALPKTGTTTLAKALRRAGLRVADWKIRTGQTGGSEIEGHHLGEVIYHDYFAGKDPLARLGDFDVINEMSAINQSCNLWPQTDWGLIAAILDHHPDTLFLLSLREPADVARSMIRWNNLGTHRLPRGDVPGLPRGYGGGTEDLARWIDGHTRFCRRVFAGCDNFLEYRTGDPAARARIARFLGVDLPWWGHSNRSPLREVSA